MMLEKTSLYNEVLAIGSKGGRNTYRMTAELYYGTTMISVYRVRALHTFADFETSYNEEIEIDLAISEGVYNQQVIPNVDQLKLNVFITTLAPNVPRTTKKFTYRAFPKTQTDAKLTTNRASELNQQVIANTSMEVYRFQLFCEAIEQLRTQQTGGKFFVTTTETLCKTLLGGVSEGLQLPLEVRPLGMQMAASDTSVVKNVIEVQQGLALCDLPGYLQEHYGVYNAGIGYFYHAQYWYVWPLYNTKRFELVKDNLVVVNVPQDKFPSIEHTFELRGSTLCVLATGESKLADNSNQIQYNQGNGSRAAKASSVLNEGVSVNAGTVLLQRSVTNNEFVTASRRNGVDNAPTVSQVTDNTCKLLSRTAHAAGSVVQVTWENADMTLISPDMPARYLYLKDGVVAQRYGVLLRTEAHYRLGADGMTNDLMLCDGALTLFIDNADETANTSL